MHYFVRGTKFKSLVYYSHFCDLGQLISSPVEQVVFHVLMHRRPLGAMIR